MEKRNIILRIMDHISACMSPVVPALLAGGLMKLVLLLVGYTGVFAYLGETEELLTAVSNAPFYFLPILLTVSCARHFETSCMFALTVVGALLLPEFVELMEQEGSLTLLGIPVIKADYAYSVVPVILIVLVQSKIEKFFRRKLPEKVRDIFVGLLTVACTAVPAILLLGPVGTLISSGLSQGIFLMEDQLPMLAWAILAGLTPLLVMTGTHWIFVSTAISLIGQQGMEEGIMSCFFILTLALSGAMAAEYLWSKDKKDKQLVLTCGLTVFLSGTSEPAIFGVCLPRRLPLITTMLAGAVTGAVQGLLPVRCFIFTFTSVPSIFMFSDSQDPQNLWNAVILGVIALVLGFTFTMGGHLLQSKRGKVISEKSPS